MVTCSRTGEMSTENPNRLLAIAVDELSSRVDCERRIGIELADPIGMYDLNRMVHQVARDYGVLALNPSMKPI
jgi:hypothetical protein